MPAGNFLAELNDLVGCRVGLAVADGEFLAAVREAGHSSLADVPRGEVVRVRSEDYAELGVSLFAMFGDTIAAEGSDPVARLVLKLLRDDAYLQPLRKFASLLHPETTPTPVPRQGAWEFAGIVSTISMFGPMTPMVGTPAVSRAEVSSQMEIEFGSSGTRLADAMFCAIDAETHLNPFSRVERNRFAKVEDLEALFASRDLVDGMFLDQRFIDFLAANVDAVQRMHWRKFEGLCATYFDRSGYTVEIGPGSNDDGVDLRFWRDDGSGPDLTIVQCKRQRDSVQKTVVKALSADVAALNAERGIIATTALVAPGAKRTIETRRYPIDIVEGDTVAAWLTELRSPGSGLSLA